MSNEDFEVWFIDKHGLEAAKPVTFNASRSKWLRTSVATYSYHLQLATALNLPLAQWLWLVNGTLLGLAVVLTVLLAYLLQIMIGLQKAQVHLLRKLEEIYGKNEDGEDEKKGNKKSKTKSRSPKEKNRSGKSFSPKSSPKGKTKKKNRSKSPRRGGGSPAAVRQGH